MDAAQIGTGNFVPMHHPDDLPLFQNPYDGQYQQIVFHEQFQRAVQGIVRSEGPNAPPESPLPIVRLVVKILPKAVASGRIALPAVSWAIVTGILTLVTVP